MLRRMAIVYVSMAAACLACLTPASARNLEIFIVNDSDYALDHESSSGDLGSYPDTIDANSTSSNIDITHPNVITSEAKITYKTDGDECSLTINATYEYTIENHCDSKDIEPTTSGLCSIVKDGECYSSGNCKCKYTFSYVGSD